MFDRIGQVLRDLHRVAFLDIAFEDSTRVDFTYPLNLHTCLRNDDQRGQRGILIGTEFLSLALEWRLYVQRYPKRPANCFSRTLYTIEFLFQIIADLQISTLPSVDSPIIS